MMKKTHWCADYVLFLYQCAGYLGTFTLKVIDLYKYGVCTLCMLASIKYLKNSRMVCLSLLKKIKFDFYMNLCRSEFPIVFMTMIAEEIQ